MDEIGLRDTVDPLAGSYFVETITKQMEDRIQEARKQIQEVGGMIQAVADGFVQKLVSQQAYDWERGVKSGEYTKIGVNKYEIPEDEPDVDLHEYDPQTRERQIEALHQSSEKEAHPKWPALQGVRGTRPPGQRKNVHAYPCGLLQGLRYRGGDGRCLSPGLR